MDNILDKLKTALGERSPTMETQAEIERLERKIILAQSWLNECSEGGDLKNALHYHAIILESSAKLKELLERKPKKHGTLTGIQGV